MLAARSWPCLLLAGLGDSPGSPHELLHVHPPAPPQLEQGSLNAPIEMRARANRGNASPPALPIPFLPLRPSAEVLQRHFSRLRPFSLMLFLLLTSTPRSCSHLPHPLRRSCALASRCLSAGRGLGRREFGTGHQFLELVSVIVFGQWRSNI